MSETLREEKGRDQVAEEKCAHDKSDQVVGAHRRSTPFRTARARVKKRAISPR
jgi:hypothetical protein